MSLYHKYRLDNYPKGSQSDKWRVSIRCNWTKQDLAEVVALPVVEEKNYQVRKERIPMVLVVVVNHL